MRAFYPKNLLFIRVIANYLMQSYVMLGKVIFLSLIHISEPTRHSAFYLVCRLLLEKKKKTNNQQTRQITKRIKKNKQKKNNNYL